MNNSFIYCRDSSHYCLLYLRVSRWFVQKPLVGCQKFANETHVIIVGRSFDARFISPMSYRPFHIAYVILILLIQFVLFLDHAALRWFTSGCDAGIE